MLKRISPRYLGGLAITLVSVFMLALLPNKGVVGIQREPNANEKVIERQFFEERSPVAVELTHAGKPLKFGEKFSADQDWLTHVCIRLKNLHPTPLIFARLYLSFPQTQATGNVMAFPLSFGRNPRALTDMGEPRRLDPEDTVELHLSQKEFSDLKTFLERRHSMASITEVRIGIDEFEFEDGSIWSGTWMRQDPNNLNRLIPIDNH